MDGGATRDLISLALIITRSTRLRRAEPAGNKLLFSRLLQPNHPSAALGIGPGYDQGHLFHSIHKVLFCNFASLA